MLWSALLTFCWNDLLWKKLIIWLNYSIRQVFLLLVFSCVQGINFIIVDYVKFLVYPTIFFLPLPENILKSYFLRTMPFQLNLRCLYADISKFSGIKLYLLLYAILNQVISTDWMQWGFEPIRGKTILPYKPTKLKIIRYLLYGQTWNQIELHLISQLTYFDFLSLVSLKFACVKGLI